MKRNSKKVVTIVTVETSWCRITVVQVQWIKTSRARKKRSRNKNKATKQPKRDGEGLTGRFGTVIMRRPSHGIMTAGMLRPELREARMRLMEMARSGKYSRDELLKEWHKVYKIRGNQDEVL